MPEPAPEPPAALPLEASAACPVCGYSLRAIARPQCPECGHELRISLRHPNPLWGRRGLLALVFAWLLVAGTLNGARAGADVHASMQPQPVQTWTINTTDGRTFTLNQGFAMPTGLTNRNGTWSITTTPTTTGTGIGASTPGLVVGRALTAAPVPIAANTGGWRAVPWDQWTRLGAWSIVALVATFGIVMLIRHRRRSASRRLVTVLTAIAWVGFGGFIAYSGLVLAAELT